MFKSAQRRDANFVRKKDFAKTLKHVRLLKRLDSDALPLNQANIGCALFPRGMLSNTVEKRVRDGFQYSEKGEFIILLERNERLQDNTQRKGSR